MSPATHWRTNVARIPSIWVNISTPMPYTGKKWGDTRSEAEKATIYKFEFIGFVSVTAAMVCRSGIA